MNKPVSVVSLDLEQHLLMQCAIMNVCITRNRWKKPESAQDAGWR